MDRSSCIARRTRKQTDSYFQNISKRSKLSQDSGVKSRSSRKTNGLNRKESDFELINIDDDEEEDEEITATAIPSDSESYRRKPIDFQDYQSSDGFDPFEDDDYEKLNRVKLPTVDDEDSDLQNVFTPPESDSDSINSFPDEYDTEDVECVEVKGKSDSVSEVNKPEQEDATRNFVRVEEEEEEVTVKKKRGRKKKTRVLDNDTEEFDQCGKSGCIEDDETEFVQVVRKKKARVLDVTTEEFEEDDVESVESEEEERVRAKKKMERKKKARVLDVATEVFEEDDVESVESEEEERVRAKKKMGRKKKARVLDIAKLLSDSILNKRGKDLMEDIALTIASEAEALPKIFSLGNPNPVVEEKSSLEKETDMLWEEMYFNMRSDEIGSSSTAYSAVINVKDEKNDSEDGVCSPGNHVSLILDLEIGLRCTVCGVVELEIKHVSPSMEKYYSRSERDTWSGPKDDFSMEEYFKSESGRQNARRSYNVMEGTVWDMIPGVRETLYPHQRDGFEFMWENLAGTFELSKLGSSGVKEKIGGCIISHAPGTGKTRLAMVFLQTYMRKFPDCRPVIVAPKGILLTWKEEFKKWNIDIPFYNMNDSDLTEVERKVADHFEKRDLSTKENRYLKLLLWSSELSILGISYNLYERLAGDKTAVEEEGKKRKKTSVVKKKLEDKRSEETEKIRKILLEYPDLLVLDEGHTPRNHNSGNWQVLSKVRTEKRIILSGTPFQNNLTELYNTLRLVRPSISKKIQPQLRKFCHKKLVPMKSSDEEKQIKELKAVIRPFVHVQTGEILTKELNGIRECVLFLNPPELQKKVLDIIDSQNTFKFEHKLSSASLHPSLFLEMESSSFTDKEKSAINKILPERNADAYKKRLRQIANQGAKMRFLLEFIRFAETLSERVLIFSQYIDPLEFVVEQFKFHFHWTEGKQVLYMDGKLNLNQRQSLIKTFNDPKTEAKVMVASTKACSEGIHLVGASRVILLDIVWNPAVERQAISRAYRLGQKRVVHIYRLMIDGTSESDKYCKQFNKGRMSETLFPSGKGIKESSGVALDDKILDEMIDHVKLKDLFVKIIYQPKESDFGGLL